MAATTEFTIGAGVDCTDGFCGELSRVIVDPIARAVTHLVVEPAHRRGLGRLVPFDVIDAVDATTGEVNLRCTLEAFEKLDIAEENRFLPGSVGYANYGPGQSLSWPHFGLGAGAVATDAGFGIGNLGEPVTFDKIPVGEVAVRRGEHVHATDADIGLVQGLVIDQSDRHVTHVLLQEGHLWGRKEVAIPIGAVAAVDDGIRLSITKQEVRDLAAVDIDYPNGAARD